MKINCLSTLQSWLPARRHLVRALLLAGLGSVISLSLTSAATWRQPGMPYPLAAGQAHAAAAPVAEVDAPKLLTALPVVRLTPAIVALPASNPPQPAERNQPCMPVAGQDDGCAAALQMVYKTVTLPSGRQGQPYSTRSIANGGTKPYRIDVTDGQLPNGLTVADDGQLSGVPSAAGASSFTLQITDASAPPLSVRQRYALRIDGLSAPRPAMPTPSSPPPKPKPQTVVSTEDANALTATTLPRIASYVLHKADLEPPAPVLLAGVPDGLALAADGVDLPAQPSQPPPKIALPNVVNPEQLIDMLTPLIGVEYPTEMLFKTALDARHCAYYVSVVSAAAKKQGGLPNTVCPPDKTKTPSPVQALSVSLPDLYEQLLPADIKKVLVKNAAESHLLSEAKPVKWDSDGCGCVAIDKKQQSYMIYPFWQADGKASQPIRFSNINRIGLLGVQLNDSGSYDTPHGLLAKDTKNVDVINTAQRFGTKVDLVLHRSDWTTLLLLGPPQQDDFLRRAAQEAVNLADTLKTDTFTKIKRFMLPGWGEPKYLYDGITVFFDSASIQPATRENQEKFKRFYKNFIDKLIAEMQKTGRSYQLSIVVPDDSIGKEGAYDFKQLMGYIESAEQPDPSHALFGASKTQYRGITDIHVRFLVTLSEPTQDSKRKLRATVDDTNLIEGNRRITFLKAIVPVIFNSGADVESAATSFNSNQMELDMTYFNWQYGGVALWPLPLADTSPKDKHTEYDINHHLGEIYGSTQVSLLNELRDAICPNRSVIRLLFVGLMILSGVAFILYFASCRVREMGRPYAVMLSVLSVIIFIVGLMLLYFDPELENLKKGNRPLIILGSVVLVGSLLRAFQQKVTRP